MLKQFYKYLIRKTVDYFDKNLNLGERYFIQFEEKEDVNQFYNVITNDPKAKDFEYKYEDEENQYNTYRTKFIEVNGKKLIIAATVDNITPNYLIILRNMLDEKVEEFENSSILFIFNEEIDSILGGAKNLLEEGQPLYIGDISNNLIKDMKNSSLKKHEEEVLKFHLNNISNKNNEQAFIWDLEEVLSFIEKGSISDNEYKKFNLFPDPALSGFSRNKMQERLKRNNEIYEMVESLKINRDSQTEIEEKFDANGAKKLDDKNWEINKFNELKDSLDNKNNFTPLEYIESNDKELDNGITFWEKPESTTKAGSRKRHIIVFNKNKVKNYSLEFEFDQTLKNKFISSTSQDIAEKKGKKLKININNANQTKFERAIYTHNEKTHSKYKFYIVNLPFAEKALEDIKTDYFIKATNRDEYIKIEEKFDGFNIPLDFNVKSDNEKINIEPTNKSNIVSFNEDLWIKDELEFELNINNHKVPFLVKDKNKKIVPKSSDWIWNSKRENKSHFELIDNKVRLNNQDFYLHSIFKKYLEYEKYIVENEVVFAQMEGEDINKIDIDLSPEIENCYMRLLDYFKENDFLPSLVYIDEELKSLIEDFIISFIDKIKNIDNNEILSSEKINLFKIGVIRNNNKLLLSPLHPLNLIYQLKVIEDLDHEKVDSKILKQLSPAKLLPYIIHKNTKYKPISQNDAREWLIYKKINNLNSEESYDYISQIIDEKIEQFYKHFNYIFKGKMRPSMKINIINVENDLNILYGIIDNILEQLKNKDINNIPKFEVKFYNQNNKNSFDKFFSLNNPEDVEEFLNLKLNVQTYSKYDVMLAIRDSIKYYFVENNVFQYAHVSFYEFKKEEKFGYYEIEKLDSGLSMGGLKASIKSGLEDNDYRMGFGLKGFDDENNLLVETAKYLNELNMNLDNNGKDPYSKGKTLVSLYSIDKEEEIKNALDQSIWVTFINPIVDIDFFQGIDNKTIVLHYSDQYTNFDNLDAITITNKSDQYSEIIKRFLAKYDDTVFNDEVIKNTINIFNSVNGEWLLNILSEDSNYTRSKLSEIASIKYLLAFLEQKDILWVPISLEEILRIAGIAGLKKDNGLFSAKNLNVKGKMSDDMLFLGVNTSNNPLELFIYPVEVKVGSNKIIKGEKQVNKTYQVLRENLSKKKDSDRLVFINKFYRNFFMQLFVSNFKNMVRLNIFEESSLDKLEKIKNSLANDDFIISDKLIDLVGKGTVISFEKDLSYSACLLEDEINILRFSERHVYTGLSQSVTDIREKLLKDNYDIKSSVLLSEKMDGESKKNKLKKDINFQKEESEDKHKKDENLIINKPDFKKEKVDQPEEENIIKKNTIINNKEKLSTDKKDNEDFLEEDNEIDLKNVRLYIGDVRGSKKKIYWEYGNSQLPNRHLLISGKSGQGKTYLIETLLYELSKNNISSLIIDYTDGFKSNQLESEFKEGIGDKLKQFYLIRDKIGINPFKMNEIVLDENYTRKEKPYDVAERIKTVISAIYSSLGIQQLNTIYNAVQSGVEEHGEEMNFDILKQKLIEDESGYSDTALSQLNSFFNQHPFKYDKDFSWEEIDKNNGNVNVIQLSGFSQDIQMLITEFMLWDLWYYKKQNGSEEKPLPLVIDEAQNLDHSAKSPTAKILTEGRKFGFSGIFSTQFLQGQLTKDEISRLQMSSQKIYFKPPDNEMNSIASDFDDKNKWKQELKKLVKGRCINKGHVYDEMKEELLGVQSIVLDVASFRER